MRGRNAALLGLLLVPGALFWRAGEARRDFFRSARADGWAIRGYPVESNGGGLEFYFWTVDGGWQPESPSFHGPTSDRWVPIRRDGSEFVVLGDREGRIVAWTNEGNFWAPLPEGCRSPCDVRESPRMFRALAHDVAPDGTAILAQRSTGFYWIEIPSGEERRITGWDPGTVGFAVTPDSRWFGIWEPIHRNWLDRLLQRPEPSPLDWTLTAVRIEDGTRVPLMHGLPSNGSRLWPPAMGTSHWDLPHPRPSPPP